MGYYLTDGIYPQWATFVKTIQSPLGNKRKYFAKTQEAVRKDVEQAFGVLQARFAIVARPARGWKNINLANVMKSCIILHNMIVEDEQDSYLEYEYDTRPDAVVTPIEISRNSQIPFSDFIDNFHSM